MRNFGMATSGNCMPSPVRAGSIDLLTNRMVMD